MALNANALVTLPLAKDLLGETSDASDAYLELLINALSSRFEDMTNMILVQRTFTDYRVDGSGSRDLYLPIGPIQSVTSIQMRYLDETVYKTITDTTKFVVKDAFGSHVQLIDETFIRGIRNILFTMSAGLAASDYRRADAVRLLIMQLAFEKRRHDNKQSGVLAESFGDGNISFAPQTSLLREVEDGLRMLRRYQAA